MSLLIHRRGLRARMGMRHHRRSFMKWETPQAVEMRFGMEITMYVSNR